MYTADNDDTWQYKRMVELLLYKETVYYYESVLQKITSVIMQLSESSH